jgi:peptidoglycan/xylan/chitin deacetylase (PgdA/CDA1 family)
MTVVPILLYHSVTDDPAGWIAPYAVTPQAFADHVALIASSGRTAMTVSALVAAMRGERALPPRPLALTFDDGFADFADAAGVLAAHNLPSTLYVTTGALRGRPVSPQLRIPPAPMLDWSQLGELSEHNVEIGAHTHTHPQLDTLPKSIAADEIRRCKYLLEDALRQEVPSFAYPHGFHSTQVRRAVEAAGYTSATAVMNALSSTSDHPFSLARLTVRATTTTAQLTAWLAGRGARVAPYPETWRTTAWRTYRRLRGNRSSRGVIAKTEAKRAPLLPPPLSK